MFYRSTYTEVLLQSDHFPLNKTGLEHGDRGLLERGVGTSIEVGAAGTDAGQLISILDRDFRFVGILTP